MPITVKTNARRSNNTSDKQSLNARLSYSKMTSVTTISSNILKSEIVFLSRDNSVAGEYVVGLFVNRLVHKQLKQEHVQDKYQLVGGCCCSSLKVVHLKNAHPGKRSQSGHKIFDRHSNVSGWGKVSLASNPGHNTKWWILIWQIFWHQQSACSNHLTWV